MAAKNKSKKVNDVPAEMVGKIRPVEFSEDLKGKTMIIYREFFYEHLQDKRFEPEQRFTVTGGFGADGDKIGRACFGEFGDGESNRVNRGNFEYVFLTEE